MVKRVDRLYILLTVIFLVGLSGLFLIQSDNSITGAAVGPIDSIVSIPQENQINQTIPIQTEPGISSNISNITFNSSPEEGRPSQTLPNSGEELSQPVSDTSKTSGSLGTTSDGNGGDIHIAANCGGAVPCACGDQIISSRTFTASDSITTATCGTSPALKVGAGSIIVDCGFRKIQGENGPTTVGIKNGAYTGVTIRNCNISNFGIGINLGVTNQRANIVSNKIINNIYGINMTETVDATITNNNFFNNNKKGIYLSASNNNTFITNNITNQEIGIELRDGSANNTFINSTIINNSQYSILDGSLAVYNTLLYNNSFGYINWTNTNLTTNISILQEGVTIFLEQNITGLATDSQTMELNGTAEIGIRNLNYFQTPQLYKDGVRCDNTDLCNITSYSQSTGILQAIVSSFSNYSAQKNNSPPTITTPVFNTSSLTLFSDLKATINYSDLNNDTSSVTFAWYVGGINVYNYTNSSVINGTNVSSILTQGNLTMFAQVNVSVYANDSVNVSQTVWSTNLSVDDDIVPNVTFVNPANGTNVSVNFQTFNATIVEHAPDTVYFMFNTNTTPFNVTATNTSGNWNASVNVSTIVEGVHIVTVFANDTSGNVNNSESITITVDRTAPTVSWITPNNNSNYSITSSNQTFNTTITDALLNVDSVLFMFNNGSGTDFNVSATNISGSWSASYNASTLAEGSQTVTVYANDTLGNTNQTEQITITTDYTAPSVTITNPINGANVSTNFQAFNTTVTDALTNINIVIFQFATNTTPFNITATNSSGDWNANVNVTNIVEGAHVMLVFANDTLNNINQTESVSFTVDRTAPTVTWQTPTNNSNYSLSSGNQIFNVTITDTLTDINTVLFMFNNASGIDFNITVTNESGYWNFTYNVSTLAEGSQTVTVYANDTLGNTNQTEQITITTDYSAPIVSIAYPVNDSRYNTTTLDLNFSVTDSLLDTCWYTIDAGVTNTTLASCANTTFTPGRGNFNITVYANDSFNSLGFANGNFSINQLPVTSNIVVNTTDVSTNDTNKNVTLYFDASDSNNDIIKNITNWYVNGTSITRLNIPFEKINGTTTNNTQDYSGQANSAIENNVIWSATGGYDGFGAYEFDGSTSHIDYTLSLDGSIDMTFMCWISPAQMPIASFSKQTIFSHVSTPGGPPDQLVFDLKNGGSDTDLSFSTNISSGLAVAYNVSNWTSGDWHHIAGTFDINSGDMALYIDGNQVDSGSAAITLGTNAANMTIGAVDGVSAVFNGSIDDCIIFNRSLSAQQVLALYNNRTDLIVSQETAVGDNWSACVTSNDGNEDGARVCSNNVTINVAPDTTFPLVTITNPVNNTNVSTNIQAFNATIVEDNIDTVIFQFGTNTTPFNVSPTNVSNNWSTNVNVSGIVEGVHIMTVFANDTTNNINQTETITFTVDRTAPIVTWIVPTNNSNYSITSSNQSFNASITDTLTDINTVLFMFNNGSGTDFNVTGVNISGSWSASYNVSTLAEGTQTVTIFANDTLGNINLTEQITINTDYTAPAVTISNPANNTNVSTNLQAFNATIVEDNIDTVIFQFGTNTTPFNVSPTNVSNNWSTNVNVSGIVEGVHVMTVYANDTSGNINQSETVTFTVDRTAPTVNMMNSSFNTTDTTPSFWFNYTDLSITANCSLYINNTLNTTNNSVLNGTNTIITSSLLSSPADYFVSINCTDGSGNTGSSSSINITVNTNTAPNTTFIIFNATTLNNYSTDTLTLWATGSDDQQTNLTAYWILYQNTTIYSNGSTDITNGTLTNIINVSSDNTTIGDNWTGSVLMSDGIINETEWNNYSVTIEAVGCGPVTGDIVFDGNLAVSGPCFSIGTSGITIDGQGNSIVGDGTGNGLALVNASNVTVTNLTISNFSTGFFADPAIGLIIDSVTIMDSGVGLELDQINQSTVSNSIFERNNLALNITDSHFNIFNKNTLTGNGSGKGIYLENSNNITIKNHTINNFSVGVYADPAVGIIFENNTVANNTNTGLVFYQINQSRVKNNLFQQNALGINLTDSYFNTITNNLFNDTLNVIDIGNNTWNATYNCSIANWTNIIGGSCQGGNFWSNYTGVDDGSGASPHNNGTDGIGDTLIPYNGTTGIYNITNGGDYLPLTSPGVSASSSSSSSGGGGSRSSTGGGSAISTTIGTTTPSVPSISEPTQKYDSNQEINQQISIDSTQVQGSKGEKGSKESGVLGAGTRLSIKLVNTGDKTLEFTPKVTSDVEIEKTNPFFIVKRKVYSPLEEKGTGITLSSKPVLGTLFLPKVTFEGVEISPEGKILVPPGEVELIIDIASPFSPKKEVSAKVEFLSFDEPFYNQDVTYSQDLVSLTGVDVNTDQKAIDMYLALASAKDIIQEEQTARQDLLTGNLIFNSANSQNQRYFLEVSLRKNVNTYQNIVIPSKFGFGKSILRNADGPEPFAELYGPYDLDVGEDFVFAQQFEYDPAIYNEEYTMRTRIVRDGNIITDDSFDLNFDANAVQNLTDKSLTDSSNFITGAIVGTIKNSFMDGFVIVMFLAILGFLFIFRENIKRNTAKTIVSTRSKFKTDNTESDLEKEMRESYEETIEWLK